jgi:hypothetical protein
MQERKQSRGGKTRRRRSHRQRNKTQRLFS